jgi:hypothetical protein
MMEDRQSTDLAGLPPHVRGLVTGLAEDGIEVTPGRLHQNRPRPEPLTPEAHLPTRNVPMREDEPITELPEMSDLPREVQEFITRLAQKGIKVTPGRPDPNRILPEPLRANTSLSAAVIEERDEYGR